MVMVFTLVSNVQDKLGEIIESSKKEKEEEIRRREEQRKMEEEVNNRYLIYRVLKLNILRVRFPLKAPFS